MERSGEVGLELEGSRVKEKVRVTQCVVDEFPPPRCAGIASVRIPSGVVGVEVT